MKLFIAPHNDDEALFGTYTLLREKPLVVIITDSWIQYNRGDNVTAEERWQETVEAMKIIGCPVVRLGIRDDIIDELAIKDKLSKFAGFEQVFAPAEVENGNLHHNMVARVAQEVFGDKLKKYQTYSRDNLHLPGTEEIIPTEEEKRIKEKVLNCYPSQLRINKPHFDAVIGGSEWFI
jgi:LmbE family N-acetylglucosaminyl deacetylase